MPSERKLADDWKVARPTATKALQALRQQGLVETRVGQGTFVLHVKAHRPARYRYHRYRERGAQVCGPMGSPEVTDAGVVDAPDYVAEALRLDHHAGDDAVPVISEKGRGPVEIATSWWSPDLAPVAPRLLVPESLGGIGSVRYVEVGDRPSRQLRAG